MGEIKVTVPDGKKADWRELNGVQVLTLVDADNHQQKPAPAPDNRPVTERIKTFEDACNALGDEHPFVTQYRLSAGAFKGDPQVEDFIAYLQLRIITYALNEGWEPQFLEDEYRYFPYFVLYTQAEIDAMDDDDKAQLLCVGGSAYGGARCGLSCADSNNGFSYSDTSIGARLAFKSSELAKYAGNQFREIYSALLFKPVQK